MHRLGVGGWEGLRVAPLLTGVESAVGAGLCRRAHVDLDAAVIGHLLLTLHGRYERRRGVRRRHLLLLLVERRHVGRVYLGVVGRTVKRNQTAHNQHVHGLNIAFHRKRKT